MAYDGQLRVSGFISGVVQGAGARVNIINQEFEQVAAGTPALRDVAGRLHALARPA